MQFNRKLVTGLVAAAIVTFAAPQAMAFSWDGWHVGIDGAYNSGRVKPNNFDLNDASGIFSKYHEEIPFNGDSPFTSFDNDYKLGKASIGIVGGYFHELENRPIVLGLNLGLKYGKKGSHAGISEVHHAEEPVVQSIEMKGGQAQLQWEGKVNGLVGWKIKDRWLPYATAGLTLDRIKVRFADGGDGSCVSCTRGQEDLNWNCEDLEDYDWAVDRFTSSNGYWSWGLNYGLGVYYALTDNWLVNAEVNRTEMWGLKGHWGTKIKGHQNTFKLGVSYKF